MKSAYFQTSNLYRKADFDFIAEMCRFDHGKTFGYFMRVPVLFNGDDIFLNFLSCCFMPNGN